MHALWVEWRAETLRTSALLALAGALEKVEPDPHVEFADLYAAPARPASQDPEERRALIARFAAL
ncbi:hypothetical protein [Streptosporangium longisporum]|uniref:hypothetical protein n=1 Tax=Streptosporangium longisporum TaxID=46187 RepID=UPI0031E7BC5C